MQLVLSLFPGIGLLDRAFEEAGFCVVRGPDLLWGGDIRTFHPPAGPWGGIIGGPPCQEFSALAPLVRHNGHEPRFGNLIPEYERCVAEAQPAWFVMENVRGAPLPDVEGYDRWAELLRDSDVGGVQPRVRRISWGMREGLWTSIASPFSLVEYDPNVPSAVVMLAGHDAASGQRDKRQQSVVGDARGVPVKVGGSGKPKRRLSVMAGHGGAPGNKKMEERGLFTGTIADMLEAQGFPSDYLDEAPFTVQGKRSAIGNGVPLPLGRAIARAVKRAL